MRAVAQDSNQLREVILPKSDPDATLQTAVETLVEKAEDVFFSVGDKDQREAEAFEELGVRAIPADESIAHAMDNALKRAALSEWMTELGRSGDVQEIEVTAAELVGKSITDLDGTLPDGMLIALVSRDGESEVPDPDVTLQHGDHLTFVGRRSAVHEAIEQCHPELGA